MEMEQMTTLEMFEKAEKEPYELFKDAVTNGYEISEYLDRVVKQDGVGSRRLPPFKKILQKEGLPIRATKGRKPAVVGDFLLPDTEPVGKRMYRRMLWHETLRLDVEETLNAYSTTQEPIDIGPMVESMDPAVQKIKGGFTVSELMEGGLLRPRTRQANQMKVHPRLVIELSDIAMGETKLDFGGEKALIINNDNPDERFSTPRLAELEEISRAKFDTQEISKNIYKYGIGVEASYEAIQNMANIGFDQVALYFSQLATYWRMEEVNQGLDTILQLFQKGTGAHQTGSNQIGITAANGGLRATAIGAESDPPVSGDAIDRASTDYTAHLGSKTITAANGSDYTLDVHSWRNMFKNFPGFVPAYLNLNHVLAQAHMTTEMEMLNLEKTNIPLDRNVGPAISGASPLPSMRTRDGMPYGWTEKIPYERFLTYDKNWALMYYTRMQSNIAETEKFILTQSQVWTITKAFGFRVYDKNAVWLISVNSRPAKVA